MHRFEHLLHVFLLHSCNIPDLLSIDFSPFTQKHPASNCQPGVSVFLPSGEAEHPESNRNPGRDPVHLPLMVCSTHCTAVTVLLSQTWDLRFKVHSRKLAIPLLVSEPPHNSTQGRLPCSLLRARFLAVGTTTMIRTFCFLFFAGKPHMRHQRRGCS